MSPLFNIKRRCNVKFNADFDNSTIFPDSSFHEMMSPSPKERNNSSIIRMEVMTLDALMQFIVPKETTISQVFHSICQTLGIRETWFFGLLQEDEKSSAESSSSPPDFSDLRIQQKWLSLDKKVSSVISNTSQNAHPILRLSFLIKFYPEDIDEEINQRITLKLLFLQIQKSILNMEIYCPAESAILLASYAIQAEFGDFNDIEDENEFNMDDENIEKGEKIEERRRKKDGKYDCEKILPKRVLTEYQLTQDMWKERVLVWYKEHKGMTTHEAHMHYLKIAQNLEMYGVQFFRMFDKNKVPVWLGITNRSVNVYVNENRMKAKFIFSYPSIKSVSCVGKRLKIKVFLPLDQQKFGDGDVEFSNLTVKYVFYCYDDNLNHVRSIVDLCVSNHMLCVRRRLPHTMNVQQMKCDSKALLIKEEKEKATHLSLLNIQSHLQSENTQLKLYVERCNQQLKILENKIKIYENQQQINTSSALHHIQNETDQRCGITSPIVAQSSFDHTNNSSTSPPVVVSHHIQNPSGSRSGGVVAECSVLSSPVSGSLEMNSPHKYIPVQLPDLVVSQNQTLASVSAPTDYMRYKGDVMEEIDDDHELTNTVLFDIQNMTSKLHQCRKEHENKTLRLKHRLNNLQFEISNIHHC